MSKNPRTKRWSQTLLLVVGIPAVLYVLWTTSNFVIAYQEIKHAHIFPKAVQGTGWEEPRNSLTQDLPAQAQFGSFTKNNSAYIELAASTSTEDELPVQEIYLPDSNVQEIELTSTPTSTPTTIPQEDVATSTIELPLPEIVPPTTSFLLPTSSVATSSETEIEPDIEDIVVPPAAHDDARLLEESTTTNMVPPNIVEILEANMPTDPPASSTATSTTGTTTSSIWREVLVSASFNVKEISAFLLSQITPIAFATTTSVSTPATSTASSTENISPNDSIADIEATSTDINLIGEATSTEPTLDDVSSCSVTGTTCYVMEYSGFGVSGSITEKEFHGALLSFSFANMSPDSDLREGKLEVRYFHAGKWRTAGDIFLNKEISNSTNGDYFTARLDGINAWQDLSDLRVVVEYMRGDERIESKLYLDSLWVDTSYKDRIQDILSGNIEDLSDIPDNISLSLPEEYTSYNTLVTDDGSRIDFDYVDTLTDNSLAVRMDRQRYKVPEDKSPSLVFASITNTTQSAKNFKVYTAFPGGKGEVLRMARYMQDVPVSTTTPVYHDVTYYCADGWQTASSTGGYQCNSSAEEYACNAITNSNVHCLVQGVHVDDATSTSYVSAWVDATLRSSVNDVEIEDKLPPGYAIAASSDESFAILPGQTIYLQLVLDTPDSTSRKFVLSVKGDGVYGDADSLRLKDELAWETQIKFAQSLPKREHINEQISEKDDFSVDESPMFKFKFKTQRPFFQRVLDFVTRAQIPYRVDSAVLKRSDGEQEFIPVEIGYDTNGEWELSIAKPPRAFKPGKYTVELQMNEAGNVYSDTIEFYWGVLAINPSKSVYDHGEVAYFSIAALDDGGNTLCDSQLELLVTDPSGATEIVPVVSGGGCGFNNVTDLPDYVAEFTPAIDGPYELTLSRLNEAGAAITSTSDNFAVQTDPPISIERKGPTRIYPVSSYEMSFEIQARDSFKGTVTEVLPEGFLVPTLGGGVLTRKSGALYLTWDLDLNAGEKKTLNYRFKAPEASPYLYILGPATFREEPAGAVRFQESRTWKIASDALSIATGVAWLSGTTTTNGIEWINTTAAAINWTTDDYDDAYYTHSTTTNNTQLTVNVAGDYLVALTVPTVRTDGSNTISEIETDLRVNGVKVNIGVGRTAHQRPTTAENTAHLTVLLHNLNVGDYIEAYSRAVVTSAAGLTARSDPRASMYVEYIPTSETVFTAIATTTTFGTNLNGTATSALMWFADSSYRTDTGYTHVNGPATSSSQITLDAQGDYFVAINIPNTGATANVRPRGRILLNGVMASSSDFAQGHISNSNGHVDGSYHWFGIVHSTSSNTKLTVATRQAENSAARTVTVNADVGSIYIQKLPSSAIYAGEATTTTGGTSFNQAATTTLLWQFDNNKDTNYYSHSTSSNPSTITVLTAGDYFLTYNDSLITATARVNPRVSVLVNGNLVHGSYVASHFVRNTGGTDSESSGTLTFLLRDLNINDQITVRTVAQGTAATMVPRQKAQLMLWHKRAQSSWIQDTWAWYQNNDAEPPTTRWTSTTADNDAITAGNSIKSGDAIRLRLGLLANTNTTAGNDTFKLQYAAGDTCSSALTWTDVGSSVSSEIWRAHGTPVADGSTLSTSLLASGAATLQTYEEDNPSAATVNSVVSGTDAEWDWSIEDNGAPTGTGYCFRMVHSSGQLLKNYDDDGYPQLVTNSTPSAPTLITMFDNEKTASTSPWFTFQSSDGNNESVDYQIQISTDPAFGTTVVDENSTSNLNDFENIETPSDKSPFNSGETIRYIDNASVLTNGTTYYWRVRATDTNGTGTSGSWSTTYSFTVDTSLTVSTWFQTQITQFNEGTLTNVEATSSVSQSVGLTAGQNSGTIWSPAITYSSHTTGNSWGNMSWTDTQSASNNIKYQIEYYTSTSTWVLIPTSDLISGNPGINNAVGTSTGPINLSNLDTDTYNTIRLKASFTRVTWTPILRDWTMAWALSVARPTITVLFDNEKTSTTTPTFKFYSTDPQGNDLVYQVQWSTDSTFTTGISSSTSDFPLGVGLFQSVNTPADTSPFTQNTVVQMQISTTTPLSNNTTYWMRVRAKDPLGGNAYSLWSTSRSFTVDTSVDRSTWFQTTTAQFNTNSLSRVTATNNTVSGITDTGKIAIYRAAVAGEAITTVTGINHRFDTTVRQDDIYSMQYASSSILLKTGYYAVTYGFRSDSTAGTSRSMMRSNFSLSSTSLPIGWSSGLMRRNSNANQAFNSGGGIIKVTSDNTPLVLQTIRTDTNPTVTQTRTNSTAAIQVVRLDSSWPYLRLSKTGTQVGPTSANWITVTYNRQDETNSTYYAHTSGSGSITLYKTGHYLVFANTYGSETTGTTNQLNQKLVLNGSDVRGSYASQFFVSTNGILEGALSTGMILEVTSPTSTLSVQMNHSVGTNPWTINAASTTAYVDRTAITIVKIPEGEFIRLSTTTSPVMNPTSVTSAFWGLEDEKDTASFSHSNVANASRIQVLINGDYLAFVNFYASSTLQTTSQYQQGWRTNGGGLLTYGQTGGFLNAATAGYSVGSWSGTIFPSLVNGDYFETITQGLSTNVSGIRASNAEVEAVRIASLSEADTVDQTIDSTDIVYSDGNGPRWDAINWNDTTPGTTDITYQLYYYASTTDTYNLVPNVLLQGRNPQFDNGSSTSGTSTGPIDISALDRMYYGTLRVRGNFTCAAGQCPSLNDWTVTWHPGITVSGIAKQYDETTNVTSGTVKVAVNGVLQSRTGSISGGTWSVSGVNATQGDVITAWISNASDANEAVGVTMASSTNNVTGMALYERHLTIGSDDNQTISNANLALYDYSASSNNEDIFYDVDAGNDLTMCPSGIAGCFLNKLFVKSGTVYRPDSSSSGNVTARHVHIDGTIVGDGNTFYVNGSWKNNYVFTKNSSTVIFTATSTAETIDSTSATTSAAFNVVTFGFTSGTTTWTLQSALGASSTLTLSFGTLVQGAYPINLDGDLSIGASGLFAKGTASTTFMGTGSNTWTDSSSAKQDLGILVVDGASKSISLSSSVRATNITIGTDDTLNAGGANTISVLGNWVNNNTFTAQTGTVSFIATSTGKVVTPGISSFYNLTFNGGNGNWSFTSNTATTTNNFTIATGTVTLPTGTTTVGGNWDTWTLIGSSFQHNNGVVVFNSTASGKTIHVSTSTAFYDMTFNGTGGAWSFIDTNATSSRSVVIQAGTVTMPSGVLAIGGSLGKTGGTLTANSGTLKFTAATAQTVALNNSNAYNMTFNGIGGSWAFTDTNATSSNNFRIENGTTTMPSGTLSVGGSFLNVNPPSSGFVHNNGIVRFTSTASGNTVLPTGSNFYDLVFSGVGGSWTITGNATSVRNTSFAQANTITLSSTKSLEVDGMFTNSLVNASTTWTGATLYLNSGTGYAINTKGPSGDTYNQLTLGDNTNISSWNSSASSVFTTSSGSLYSQNNASSSGSLYIYGAFATSSNVYWNYSNDFDGIALSGAAQRQVSVKIASSSIVTLSGSTTIHGATTATTTIANQGVGFYSFNITAGTTSAQYYSFASTTPAGLSISGSNTVVSSLDNGEFVLSTPAQGTSITIASTVIDRNPFLQILYTRFATSTGVLNGYNVTESGVPTDSGNYWWFKNGYGPFYGESYDSDPGPGGGNPGYVQFDDSGITATFTGRVYADHGTTAIGPSVCETGTTTAQIVFRTSSGLSYSGTCDNSGAFSIPVTLITSNVVTAYLNTNGGAKAVTITKNVTGNVTNFDLYQNAIIVRQADVTPTTIADMNFNDSSVDSDIPFAATSSLMVQPGNELYVWTGKLFSPGGDVILQSANSNDARDGSLYLATSSTLTLSGTLNIAVGGSMIADSGITFTSGSSVFTFTGTTSNKTIFSTKPLSFYDVVFDGVGGQWQLLGTSTATTSIRTMALTAGTVAGTGDVDVRSGGVTGGGTITMTGGTFLIEGTGNFGNSNPWTFRNLTFGTSTAHTITKTGLSTTTVTNILRLSPNQTLYAGTDAVQAWVLSGAGTPFVITGATFNVQAAPFFYTGTTATNITAATYGPLYLVPSSGSPTYTLLSGNLTPYHFIIGNGNTVTVSGTTNDPNIDITGDFVIASGATYVAPDAINSNIKGSWTNNGTFTPSGRFVIFDATTTGKTINPGSSSFYDIQFNSSAGGWTIVGNATSTHNTTLSAAASFAVTPGKSLEVVGTFANSVASSSQTWTGSTLYLNSGTSYSINAKTSGNATYGQLTVGANTKIRNWNSYAATTSVSSSGSLYAQNYASSSGQLYIWGAYTNSSGSDYWDYSTDFDGISLGGTSRQVNVYIASSSVLTFSGGLLDIIGSAAASTTIQAQGSGTFAWSVSGGTLNAQYYQVRNTDANGLNLSGYPVVTGLGNGDYHISTSTYTAIKIDGTVISANPLKVIRYVKFATSTPGVSAYNVTAVNATSSYWKFNLGYGNLYGEEYDNDVGGDPGYVRFDNSNDHISVSGKVYSDEVGTVSTLCDDSTQVVRIKVQGLGSLTASCASGSGTYTFPDVGFNPGDVFTVYVASSSKRSATVTRSPTGNITDLDIYEHRVILRHEDGTPINIQDIDQFDSGNDSLVPFLATDAVTDTLVVEPNTKLIVWTGKTFAPAGNVTVQSGGVGGAVDGTLELYSNSTLSASGSQSHAIGGSFLVGTGATFSAANSTITFTATTTGKTITPNTSTFYNVTFNGIGGNWAFSGAATSTNDFIIATGTVTLPTSVLEVGSSFLNIGGAFQHNNGLVKLISAASEKSVMVNSSPFYNLNANGIGGSWRFVDGTATTSNDLTITAGTFRAPTTTLVVGGSFSNVATFTANSGTVKMTAVTGGKSIQAGGSNFYSLSFNGVGGGWSFVDLNATTSRDFIIATGTVTLPYSSLGVGGNFTASSTFYSTSSTVRFAATTTGFTISVATSTFGNLVFDASAGGWTIISNATSTASTTISNAASFTLQSGKSLEVNGTFTNSVGGAPTTWTGSVLYLNSGTNYSLNSKTNTGDTYGQLTLGANTNVRSWGSTAATTTAATTGSLYSQNNANTSGSLYIYGTYTRSSGTDYWSYATDFDGTDISGTPRQAQVRIATSSTASFTGGNLTMIGSATASTTVFASGTTGYGFSFAGGTLNAQYYQFKNMDENGVSLSGASIITSLSNGDFELSASSGTIMTLAGTVIDANSGISISAVKMASTSANIKGFNVMVTGTPGSFWTFTGAYGNVSGENFDADGTTLCGRVRWDDSDCQFLNESHYRWRNDDGGEGAVSTTWYDASFTKRQRIAISNPNATTYTNLPVKIVVPYDSDMQADFDDLRFTDSTGTNGITYWREKTINSASTTVWVKLSSLSSSGSAVIYMYYSSTTAPSADDGSNTFSYFEDFEDNDISDFSGDKQQIGTVYFDMSQSSSFNYSGSRGLPGSETSGQTPNGLYKTGTQTATNKTIRWWQYVNAEAGVGLNNDEPCTLFGVQTPGGSAVTNDYAVCLDEFNVGANHPRISIARDTHSRDLAGTVMASTSVTYATGWYEVVTNWISASPSNQISVSLYNASGGLVATVSTTSNLYSSGGIGFGHFNQGGGWDNIMVKPYTAINPTYLFGSEQLNNGATWRHAEDTTATGVLPNENIRLRFSLQNTGTAVTNHLYRLQYAPKGGATNCESVEAVNYNDVPTETASCGSHAACMKTSSQFTNLASTSPSLSFPASLAWTPGYIIEDPSNQSNGMSVGNNVATEVEYNFQITNSATQTSYCFRVVNGGTDLANYDRVAEAQIAFPPYISNLTLNNAQHINLDEGTSTIIYATSTVTDNNGYTDISFATSTIYRSGVTDGAACTSDYNNCYQSSAPLCSLSDCAGNSCTLSCVAYIQYFAEPTDVGSTYSAQNWLATIAVQDSDGYRDTDTFSGVDLNTLRALAVTTGNLDFGSLEVGQNTGTTDATTTARNTGNVPIDIDVSGTHLQGSLGVIATSSQIYATSTFAYGSCSICQFLSGTAAPANVNIAKPTSTTTAQQQDIYFGITIPGGTGTGLHTGVNTFTAIPPSP